MKNLLEFFVCCKNKELDDSAIVRRTDEYPSLKEPCDLMQIMKTILPSLFETFLCMFTMGNDIVLDLSKMLHE